MRRVQPFLTNLHKAMRKALVNWIRINFQKEQTMRILVDIHGVCKTIECELRIVLKRMKEVKLSKREQIFMVWLGPCSTSISPLIMPEYIKEVLPVTLKYV